VERKQLTIDRLVAAASADAASSNPLSCFLKLLLGSWFGRLEAVDWLLAVEEIFEIDVADGNAAQILTVGQLSQGRVG
jgi:hypothetical protein